jgi:uncharacterized damage-inducible protein DinB
MTTRVEEFAAQFETANNEFIATVEGCTDAQWRQPCASEGWSIGVVAHHVAVVYPAFAGIVERLATGVTLPPRSSMDAVHRSNAQHARDYADVGKTETLDALRANGAAVTQRLRSLSDEQLDRIAGVFGDRELSTAQVVEWIVIGHTREHLASIRATIAA